MVKHISLCTSLSLGKPSFLAKERKALFGKGIMASSGPFWAYQKKIIAPELYMDKVKVNSNSIFHPPPKIKLLPLHALMILKIVP